MKNIKQKSILSTMAMGGIAVLLVAGCGTTAGNNTTNPTTGQGAGNTTSSGSAASTKKISAINVTATANPNAEPKAGTIVIGTDDTYPPDEYTNASGQLLGFDVDLGDALGQVLHKKVIWKPTAWDGIIPGLEANKYDAIISFMNVTPQREQQIQFIPYGTFGQVIVTKANSSAPITTLNDLKGKKVGVQIGTTSEDAVKKVGGAIIKEYNTFPDALNDLANGRINAVVVDESVGRYYMAKDPGVFKVAGQPFASEPVGIGLRKNETQLDQQLQQALNTLKQNGTYNKIYTYWFGAPSK
ncbi:substrate-binding periplasmic protein [Alicyclobacillus ferrooxydans]|uniref:substrate-binding periplasmic protein n=1 Tax=Alicyclobacillus ferrooxydans TaxID=471514 RepID=UPI0006D53184|nr:transporter substrate-binding domain-containing protein [Alicyclobacillus ferrooxydans]